MPIRIVIVDRHAIVRAGIRQSCAQRSDLEILAEESELEGCVERIASVGPDVVIVDPQTSDARAPVLVRQLCDRVPEARVIVFTEMDRSDFARQMLASGAAGFLTKSAGLDEIVVAVTSVHAGRVFISHSNQSAVSLSTMSGRVDRIDAPSPPQLSGREREVLSMLADGYTNKQAAEALFLSVKTVETYRARIMKKHRLRDRADLIQFARREAGELASVS